MPTFRCPACSVAMVANDGDAGRHVLCPKCGQRLQIPTPEPAVVTVLQPIPDDDYDDRRRPRRRRRSEQRPVQETGTKTFLNIVWYVAQFILAVLAIKAIVAIVLIVTIILVMMLSR